jgi:glycosyltransferase involved in cell wall biosynthesis
MERSAQSPLSARFESGLVSIVISTYNRAALLSQAIESVIEQSYEDWEIVLVDDGSTDKTANVVASIQARTPGRRILYRAQKNQGPQAARNEGMRCARGEYIQFLDSDDLLHARKLELQVRHLVERPDLDLVLGSVADFDDIERLPRRVASSPMRGSIDLESFDGASYFLIHAPLCRRTSLMTIGPWDEGVVYGHETEFFGRALARGLVGEVTTGAWAYRRRHVGRYSVELDRLSALRGIERTYSSICEEAWRWGRPPPRLLRWALAWVRLEARTLQGDRSSALAALDEIESMAPDDHPLTSRLILALRRGLLLTLGTPGHRLLQKLVTAWRLGPRRERTAGHLTH